MLLMTKWMAKWSMCLLASQLSQSSKNLWVRNRTGCGVGSELSVLREHSRVRKKAVEWVLLGGMSRCSERFIQTHKANTAF